MMKDHRAIISMVPNAVEAPPAHFDKWLSGSACVREYADAYVHNSQRLLLCGHWSLLLSCSWLRYCAQERRLSDCQTYRLDRGQFLKLQPWVLMLVHMRAQPVLLMTWLNLLGTFAGQQGMRACMHCDMGVGSLDDNKQAHKPSTTSDT